MQTQAPIRSIIENVRGHKSTTSIPSSASTPPFGPPFQSTVNSMKLDGHSRPGRTLAASPGPCREVSLTVSQTVRCEPRSDLVNP